MALLDARRVGEGADVVRNLAQRALQQLIQAEATDLVLSIPKLRVESQVVVGFGSTVR